MKLKPLIKTVIYSSWFLAALPAAVIIFILPHLGAKYSLEIKKFTHFEKGSVYVDLNGDNVSERVATSTGGTYYFVNVRSNDEHFFDQWNLQDSLFPDISQIFYGDCNHNKNKEIYIFTHSADSLFLNVNEVLDPDGIRLGHRFISKVGYRRGQIACNVKFAGFYDVDGDGCDEFFFTVSSYYRLGIRGLFCYNVSKNTVSSSQFVGNIFIRPFIEDIDADTVPEIFGNTSASGNYPANTPCSDSSNWLMVFTPDLRFKFPPVEFPGFANSLTVFPYRTDGFKGFLLSLKANGANSSLKSTTMIYTSGGLEVRRRTMKDFGSNECAEVLVFGSKPDDRVFVLGDRLYELNAKLEVIRSVKLSYRNKPFISVGDLEGDGKKDILLYYENEHKLVVYDSSLHKLTETPFDPPEPEWRCMSYYDVNHLYKLYISSGDRGYLLNLRKNKYYFLIFPVYPAIYLSIFFFIILIKKIGTAQQKVQQDLNTRLLTLQLQGIKAQLDPHFTFNTLNSIASLIYLEDRQTAYDYMRKFTELLRSMLNDAEKIYRNLGDEIEFVKTYLELEKLRFGKKFDYLIETGDGVTLEAQVPKLVLQTFAENAVKHGFMSTESGGLIKISVLREKDFLKLSVEDNGIGRARAAGQSKSTGRGMKLTREFYEILNQINKRPIRLQITDLHDAYNIPSGTRVDVWVPVEEQSVQPSI